MAKTNVKYSDVTVIIPAKNEADSLRILLPEILNLYDGVEVVVVNDGSNDDTSTLLSELGVEEVCHPYSIGNGGAIKSGLRAAKGKVVVCMDGDGQHRPSDIGKLLCKLSEGYDMVVGARRKEGQASIHRHIANSFYNKFSSWMAGQNIRDLTSGFRAIQKKKALEFIDLLPNKFSYPTTMTMSFFRSGYLVAYENIDVCSRREGSVSHVNVYKDGVRFLLIIFKVGTLYSPLKLFFPISFSLFISGVVYYIYTYLSNGLFTNMGALLLTTSVTIFLMGLISEQINALLYKK